MNKKFIYVTYQTFPAQTANSFQTISNLRFLSKEGVNVHLYFPLREKTSDGKIENLQKFYNFNESFEVTGLEHNYPHGRIKFLKKVWFLISHFSWSRKVVKHYFKNERDAVFFTRSEWVAYFISKYNCDITLEVHQTSKIRNFVINKLKNKKNVKFIFLNELLKKHYEPIENSIVLHNGVARVKNKKNVSKESNLILFAGSISRFNKSRGIKNLIEWFKNDYIFNNFKLEIVGGSESDVNELRLLVKSLNLENIIKITGWTSQIEVNNKLTKASIGLLVNTSKNKHSYKYTSPLKYFEYLNAGLSVLAVDFPSHRSLPFSDKINFFRDGDEKSFEFTLKNFNHYLLTNAELDTISLQVRAKKIIEFIF